MGILIVVIVVVVVIGTMVSNSTRLTQARNAYWQALAYLKANPGDPRLREDALYKGRVYSNLTRNSKGVTIYDEMAIKNDLDAATAASFQAAAYQATAFQNPAAQQPPLQIAGSINDRLRQLDELKAQGLISPSEHAQRRQAIINQI